MGYTKCASGVFGGNDVGVADFLMPIRPYSRFGSILGHFEISRGLSRGYVTPILVDSFPHLLLSDSSSNTADKYLVVKAC